MTEIDSPSAAMKPAGFELLQVSPRADAQRTGCEGPAFMADSKGKDAVKQTSVAFLQAVIESSSAIATSDCACKNPLPANRDRQTF